MTKLSFLDDKKAVSKGAAIGIIVAILVVAVVAVLLAGGSLGGIPVTTTPPATSPTQPPTPSAIKLELTVQDSASTWAFKLGNEVNPTIRVTPSTEVQLTLNNNGVTVHDFTVDELGVTASKTTANQGKTVTVTFKADKPGTYTYYCAQPGHKELGMKGSFIVS